MGGGGGLGGIVSSIFGGSEPTAGGVGGINDLTGGLQEMGNEYLAGLGSDRQTRQANVQQFATQLQNQAMGTAPSIADAQLKMAMEKNLSQQIAAAKANRAVNPALQARMIQQASQQNFQNLAQQGAVDRLAEQKQAQNQYASFLGQQQQLAAQTRASALGGANAAQNINAANQARTDNILMGAAQGGAMLAMSDKNLKTLVKKYNKGGMVKEPKVKKYASGGLIPDIAGGKGLEQLANGQNAQDAGTALGKAFAKLGSKPDAAYTMAGGPMDNMGAVGELAPALMMAANGGKVPGKAEVSGDSEKNDKVPALLSPGEIVVPRTVVKKGDKAVSKFIKDLIAKESKQPEKMSKGGIACYSKGGKVDEFEPKNFLSKLNAVSYEYNKKGREAGAPEGRKLGIMAQDLEKAGPVGQSMVKETPAGKMVDFGAGFGAILASQADLNKRLQEIENKWNKKGGK